MRITFEINALLQVVPGGIVLNMTPEQSVKYTALMRETSAMTQELHALMIHDGDIGWKFLCHTHVFVNVWQFWKTSICVSVWREEFESRRDTWHRSVLFFFSFASDVICCSLSRREESSKKNCRLACLLACVSAGSKEHRFKMTTKQPFGKLDQRNSSVGSSNLRSDLINNQLIIS